MFFKCVSVGVLGLLAFIASYAITGSGIGGLAGTIALGALLGGTIAISRKIGASWATRRRIQVMLLVAILCALLGALEFFAGDKTRGLVGIVAALFIVMGASALRDDRVQGNRLR